MAAADADVRLNAVIAALEKVRDHIKDIGDEEQDIDAATYNRWIALLDGVIEGDCSLLTLEDTEYVASEMRMHVDAAIAFLTAHRAA